MTDPLSRERRALAVAVRELRVRRSLKQEEVGEAAGLGRNYLTTLENGRTNPSFDALVRLSRGLGVPLSELVRTYEERLRD
ncbi:helix-turn-helix domain-containing protein [Conexibacter sp. CPCC 206217]|uniref:helix-turn-helix domain-containing protein n=1 Tax=Conexibacter sp. CPCC 206217 TaxID=3064574 RepID=UPI002715808D|nr:helix-turn-helix transcriptional regulator [Conexibacter sp. CPCC 206217]MDO8210721.1 helix-turn-helix transcriptional regulator [Conexibacter sp. CPCC 206217]